MNRRRLLILSIVLTVVAAACGGAGGDSSNLSSATSAPVGDPAPTTSFQTFDSAPATLADFTGKPVVLNFWASWCPSCVAEMSAAFRPVQQDLGADITFLGMNIQDDRVLADQLLTETGVEWINAEDPTGDLYVELGGIAMPFTVYLNADGRVVEKHNGPLTEDQLRQQIAEVFG